MTSPDYQVRPANESDRAQWNPLWQGYLEFYQSSLADEITDLLWQRIMDPAHEIQCRVAASSDGNLVGMVHFFPHAHTWHARPVCYLNDLYVVPGIRGGGIGKMLIDAVIDAARQQRWAEVYWHTQSHNSVARGLYDKITGGTDGFVNYTIDLGNQAAR
ncbi:MAG: GNAT family N-acetyltransferase [Gammaproteobacteria bacterium]|nr:GNAT family N-acetyltransferase [Gammaproteobacteria bacterium]